VADSYDGARRPCVRYLDRFNFDVAEVTNGDDALKQISSAPPRVIVAEWLLPSMPADRLCEWLSQRPRTRDIPVIVVAADFDARRHLPGVAAVLVKPFSLESMLAEVRRALHEPQS
jgi:two-component system, OmpR family, phosphate regulon response regulator PhoB